MPTSIHDKVLDREDGERDRRLTQNRMLLFDNRRYYADSIRSVVLG